MSTSTLELKKAIQTLETAIQLYSRALSGSEEKKAFRDACIQRFEYSIELSWKISMRVLGSTTAAAKPAIREMARNNLISDAELWLSFIEARNNSSHSYEEDIANKVYASIEQFMTEAPLLLKKLESL